MKKILLLLSFLFFSCCTVFADELIASAYTKISVKMMKPFEELSQGETLKFIVNPRSLKNKKINWGTLNLSENSKPFFVGTVEKVNVRPYKSSDGTMYYFYSASFNINKLIVNGKSYKVNGSFEADENNMTHNYNVVLNSEFQDSDFDGEFVDNIEDNNKNIPINRATGPHFFGGMDEHTSLLTALKQIDTLADTSIELTFGWPHKEYYTPENIKNKINKNDLSRVLSNAYIKNPRIKSFFFSEGSAKMPTGEYTFLTAHVLKIEAKKIYIKNLPFSIVMEFKPQVALYYTRPDECFKLSDGAIVSYYLSNVYLYPAHEKNEILDYKIIPNLYEKTYPNKYCSLGTFWPYQKYVCTNQYSIDIRATNEGQIEYSYNEHVKRKEQLLYEEYLENETHKKYKNKQDSSNLI